MMQYSKLFGGLFGSVLGIATMAGVAIPPAVLAPELQAGAVGLLALLATYLAPANKG